MVARAERIIAWTRAALWTHSAGIVVGLLGTLLLFHDLWGRDWSSTLWGGQYDPKFLYWTFQWGYHVLFEQWDWLGFYDANVYFPHHNTLAFADPMLSAMVLYAPLRWIGVTALPAIYLTLMGLCLVGSVLTNAALMRLGGSLRWQERALIVFAAHFSLPVISFFGTHYQLFGMQLAPPFLLYTFLYVRHWERRDLVAAGTLYLAGSLCAVYMAVMGGLLALLLTVPTVLRAAWSSRPRKPWLMARLKDALYVLLPLAAVGYLLLVMPYFEMHAPPRSPWSSTRPSRRACTPSSRIPRTIPTGTPRAGTRKGSESSPAFQGGCCWCRPRWAWPGCCLLAARRPRPRGQASAPGRCGHTGCGCCCCRWCCHGDR